MSPRKSPALEAERRTAAYDPLRHDFLDRISRHVVELERRAAESSAELANVQARLAAVEAGHVAQTHELEAILSAVARERSRLAANHAGEEISGRPLDPQTAGGDDVVYLYSVVASPPANKGLGSPVGEMPSGQGLGIYNSVISPMDGKRSRTASGSGWMSARSPVNGSPHQARQQSGRDMSAPAETQATDQTQATNKVETAPANNDVETAPANNDVETAPANNDVETAQANNVVETPQVNNEVVTAQAENAVKTPQVNNAVENSQAINAVESADASNAVEATQPNKEIETTQANEDVETPQVNNAVETARANEAAETQATAGVSNDQTTGLFPPRDGRKRHFARRSGIAFNLGRRSMSTRPPIVHAETATSSNGASRPMPIPEHEQGQSLSATQPQLAVRGGPPQAPSGRVSTDSASNGAGSGPGMPVPGPMPTWSSASTKTLGRPDDDMEGIDSSEGVANGGSGASSNATVPTSPAISPAKPGVQDPPIEEVPGSTAQGAPIEKVPESTAQGPRDMPFPSQAALGSVEDQETGAVQGSAAQGTSGDVPMISPAGTNSPGAVGDTLQEKSSPESENHQTPTSNGVGLASTDALEGHSAEEVASSTASPADIPSSARLNAPAPRIKGGTASRPDPPNGTILAAQKFPDPGRQATSPAQPGDPSPDTPMSGTEPPPDGPRTNGKATAPTPTPKPTSAPNTTMAEEAIAAMPEPNLSVPEHGIVFPTRFFNAVVGGGTSLFANASAAMLEKQAYRVPEMIKANPDVHAQCPLPGKHGALTVVEGLKRNGVSGMQYPLFRKTDPGWTYCGQFEIARRLTVPVAVWEGWDQLARQKVARGVEKSTRGQELLLSKGLARDDQHLQSMDCSDILGFFGKDGEPCLRMGWIVLRCVGYDRALYDALAMALATHPKAYFSGAVATPSTGVGTKRPSSSPAYETPSNKLRCRSGRPSTPPRPTPSTSRPMTPPPQPRLPEAESARDGARVSGDGSGSWKRSSRRTPRKDYRIVRPELDGPLFADDWEETGGWGVQAGGAEK
ncbi:MAG: hypothetical protein M1832_001501 [Thelocarpon impressellum]|nr:MAG: hypothetical protein M1832_001501 [Thelocarpon impressellum]